MGKLLVPGFWLSSGLAVTATWRVNQHMKDLCVHLSFSLKSAFQMKINVSKKKKDKENNNRDYEPALDLGLKFQVQNRGLGGWE